ncbi:uncharacterized protein K452DRAFT_138304 [Aplosporella prunicola CBS 121167]|uniref:Uncharacterized protein n=1 Tax=Aplosporella prunicola CBS 121167 TaxID=1176127 RepID=A0A6A6AZ37_9PEZI|nr:uncharacterized protein K452DRAFT_139066 [Aplosporella prunicola CBS 121167]XP_033392072.1 uncharacterized protein K452DRAFT_138304 [Aplosporella prunicola CBS 121167]KAF2136264.1 hypothetical protein K452DRAFT_139066 [Aplosporella prunicola CBS 121167]KAF2136354.1 hypothetical protein K452DRAFT_138304 [Aplosporella prunicola CBS 121167]
MGLPWKAAAWSSGGFRGRVKRKHAFRPRKQNHHLCAAPGPLIGGRIAATVTARKSFPAMHAALGPACLITTFCLVTASLNFRHRTCLFLRGARILIHGVSRISHLNFTQRFK